MDNIKQNIADALAKVLEKDTNEILISIEKPKDSSMGDFAYPCFRLASVMKKAPMLIAQELKEKIGDISGVTDVQVVSGYLNFYADNNYVIETTLKEILTKQDDCYNLTEGNGKTICVDYSSPNIALNSSIVINT